MQVLLFNYEIEKIVNRPFFKFQCLLRGLEPQFLCPFTCTKNSCFHLCISIILLLLYNAHKNKLHHPISVCTLAHRSCKTSGFHKKIKTSFSSTYYSKQTFQICCSVATLNTTTLVLQCCDTTTTTLQHYMKKFETLFAYLNFIIFCLNLKISHLFTKIFFKFLARK